jgi:trehalose synthase
MQHEQKLIHIEDYEPLVGAEMIDRIRGKAELLRDQRVAHVNSTANGGGVAELLSSLSLLMNSIGIETAWRVVEGTPDFFNITKQMHNALQGDEIELSAVDQQIYQNTAYENAVRNHLDFTRVIVHDPQPLPLIDYYNKQGPWIWQCHVDLTSPNCKLWDFLSQFINKYDAAIFSLEEYAQGLDIRQAFLMPAIDPFTMKNKQLSEEEIQQCLDSYEIPTDLPLVVQISRFDPWKDPEGVIAAFKRAREKVDATLVLLGNFASDDPEGDKIYESLLGHRDERIILLSVGDSHLVNALQSRAAVVLQKSIREGFGLTVSEAMWKGTPVIGGNVGGIRHQIENGVNGFLVSSVDEAAERIVQLIEDPIRRQEMGRHAKETVRKRFLMVRLLEQYLDLLSDVETDYHSARQPVPERVNAW